jgi:hypothetical protein
MMRLALTMMMLIGLAVYSPSQTQSDRKQTCERPNCFKGLEISATLDKTDYRWGDIGRMTFTIKNVGNEPIAILKDLGWGPSSSLGFALGAIRGKTTHPARLDDAHDRPPYQREDFVVLKPGEFIEGNRHFNIDQDGGIVEPGIYEAVVWYHSPVWQEYAPDGLKIWPKENDSIECKSVRFTVTK